MSRLFDALLGPANVAFWAPRIAIPDTGGMALASVRSARGRVGAFSRRGGGLLVGRAGRECMSASSRGLIPCVPLLVLDVSISKTGGLLVMPVGASCCSNRKK